MSADSDGQANETRWQLVKIPVLCYQHGPLGQHKNSPTSGCRRTERPLAEHGPSMAHS
jgi:hypothetical protein